jgi:hypothetical protein
LPCCRLFLSLLPFFFFPLKWSIISCAPKAVLWVWTTHLLVQYFCLSS